VRCELCNAEPSEWLLVAQVQERVWLAEVVGRFHQFLSLLLQVTPGKMMLLLLRVELCRHIFCHSVCQFVSRITRRTHYGNGRRPNMVGMAKV